MPTHLHLKTPFKSAGEAWNTINRMGLPNATRVVDGELANPVYAITLDLDGYAMITVDDAAPQEVLSALAKNLASITKSKVAAKKTEDPRMIKYERLAEVVGSVI